jgi:hypothetical protein
MVVMESVVDREKPARNNDALRAAIEWLKKSAPPSLTVTSEALDAYSAKLLNLVHEYNVQRQGVWSRSIRARGLKQANKGRQGKQAKKLSLCGSV